MPSKVTLWLNRLKETNPAVYKIVQQRNKDRARGYYVEKCRQIGKVPQTYEKTGIVATNRGNYHAQYQKLWRKKRNPNTKQRVAYERVPGLIPFKSKSVPYKQWYNDFKTNYPERFRQWRDILNYKKKIRVNN